MNSKQKFGYTILGAVIMAVGIGIGAIISPSLTAQSNGVFDEIVCRKLTVVNEEGTEKIVLEENLLGGEIRIYNMKNNPTFRVTSGIGGMLDLCDIEGKLTVRIYGSSGAVVLHGPPYPEGDRRYIGTEYGVFSIEEHGGHIKLRNNEGKVAGSLGVGERGGYVQIQDKNEKEMGTLYVGEHGGIIKVLGKEGTFNNFAFMSANKEGSDMSVRGKQGSIYINTRKTSGPYVRINSGKDDDRVVIMSTDKHGGIVFVGGKGEGKAVLGINEYGNGIMNTWDKNGYRQ